MRGGHPAALDEHSEGNFKRADNEPASLQPARRAAPEHLPHEETEVERARVNEQPLQDVLMPAQVGAAEAAGVIHVGEGALDVLAAAPQQPRTVSRSSSTLDESGAGPYPPSPRASLTTRTRTRPGC